ncbi:MAG: hypothetical protein EXS32_03895 [Opitutus sp.]|nr:hypothetical protein [Opitutus sp.]
MSRQPRDPRPVRPRSKPVFGERDRPIHYAVTELSNGRRRGYSWHNSHAAIVFGPDAAWCKKYGATK